VTEGKRRILSVVAFEQRCVLNCDMLEVRGVDSLQKACVLFQQFPIGDAVRVLGNKKSVELHRIIK
jgi:hypothetical protein